MTALRTEGHTTDHTLSPSLESRATSDTELSERGRDRAGGEESATLSGRELKSSVGLSFGGGLIAAGAIS